MAMSTGNERGGLTNEPNVTPMIDVLLVLLIIFMIVVPMSRKAIDIQLPDPTQQPEPNQKPPDQIVLEVLPGNQFAMNKQPMAKDDVAQRLHEIFAIVPTRSSSSRVIPPSNTRMSSGRWTWRGARA